MRPQATALAEGFFTRRHRGGALRTWGRCSIPEAHDLQGFGINWSTTYTQYTVVRATSTTSRVEYRIQPNRVTRHPHNIDLLRQATDIALLVVHQPIKAIHRGKLHPAQPFFRAIHRLLLHIEGKETRLSRRIKFVMKRSIVVAEGGIARRVLHPAPSGSEELPPSVNHLLSLTLSLNSALDLIKIAHPVSALLIVVQQIDCIKERWERGGSPTLTLRGER